MELTAGYIQGTEDCLKDVAKHIDELLKKHNVNTNKGLVDVVNGIIGYTYYKDLQLAEMKVSFEELMNNTPDLFEGEEECCCTCEECEPQEEMEVVVTSNGTKLMLVVDNTREVY